MISLDLFVLVHYFCNHDSNGTTHVLVHYFCNHDSNGTTHITLYTKSFYNQSDTNQINGLNAFELDFLPDRTKFCLIIYPAVLHDFIDCDNNLNCVLLTG